MLQLLNLPVSHRAIAALLTPFYFLFQTKKMLFRFATLVMSIVMMSAVVGQATVNSDKDDYAPLSNAVFTGAGFAPFEQVVLKVKNLSQPCNTISPDSSYLPFTVTADASGGFVTNWTVCNCPGDSLRLKATGQTSGLIAYKYFTDAPDDWTLSVSANLPTICVGTQTTFTIRITGVGNGSSSIGCANVNIPSSFGTLGTPSSLSSNIPAADLATWSISRTASVIQVKTTDNNDRLTNGQYVEFTITATPTTIAGSPFIWTGGATQNTNCNGQVAPQNPLPTTSVNAGTVITTNPINQSITYGNNAGFSVVATGALGYQWQEKIGAGSFSNISNGGIYSGATTTNLTLTNPEVALSGRQYRVVINGSCGLIESNAVTLTVGKAASVTTVTINGGPFTYTGLAQTPATVSITGTGGVVLATATATYANNINAGTATASYTYAGDANHEGSSDSENFAIGKATATVSVDAYSVTYDGNSHTSTYIITGVNGESGATVGTINVSGTTHTDAGTYTGDAWSFTGSSNYNDANGTVNNVINKADATVSVTGYSGTYDASAHGASGTATGVGGVNLAAGLNLGATFTDVPGGTANWTFSGGTNYNDQNGSVAIVINKANATVSVTGYSGTYDGNAHGASGTATGVGGVNLAAGLNLGATFTDVPGGTADWTFNGGTNYNDQSGSVAIVINKANATVSVTGYTGTYDGNAHGASGTATGVGGVDLAAGLNLGATFTDVPGGTADWTFSGGTNYNDQSGSVAIVINKANAIVSVTGYSGTYDATAHGASGTATGVGGINLAAGLNLGATFTDVPGGTANWTFDGGTNYNDQSGSVAIVINKANATVNVTGYSGTYDASAHGASGTATGVGGVNLAAGLNLDATFTDVPGGTANWTFSGGTNYNDQSGSVQIVINKAPSITTVTINGGPFTYTGLAQTPATVSITGAGGVVLATPTATYANNTNAGTATASYTYSGDANHEGSSDSEDFIIDKAASVTTVTINGGPFTYTGLAQTPATVSVTGAGGVVLATPTATYANNINAGTATASYSYAGDTNHEGSSDSENFAIGKATATVSVTPYSVTYDGNSHTSTYSITGVNGESGAVVGAINVSATTHTNAGTYNGDVWSFTGTSNYNDANGTVNNVINKAHATVNVTGYSGTYDASAHGATGTATGVGGVNLAAGLNLGATFTNVPGGTANWTFNGGTNYNNQSGSVAIVINKKSASVTANTASKYCGQADPALTGALSGFIGSDNVTATYNRTSGESAGGSYVISATLSPVGILGNYNITYNTASFTINGLAIDASASSTPVAIGQNATLSAIVNPVVAGVTVKFFVDGVEKGPGITNSLGIATYTLTGLNTTDVFKIEAIAGSGGCASTAAYLPVYDPNGAFVTGGGWINSLAGALTADPLVVGKANFGFVSKYKKGSSIVDGNTEFQFHAGDINFKSTMHESGSLVISGAKATYRGTGTINGLAGYKFTIVAIDGNWNNGFAPDKFRIKITTTTGQVVYDNQMGKDDNADDATELGGGSIVIHEVKKKTANRMDPGVLILAPQEFAVKVIGNPSITTFRLQLQSSNMQEKFTVKVVDINGRLIEVQQNLYAGQVIELGSKYTQGTYFAEVMQGTNRKVVKLIKIGRD